tara:strand:- start:111 stop:374 length:264 start_codon:yes stop_codon:yes gene_type:complete
MPKGYTSEFGYATVSSGEGCLTYREIAEIMTADGDKINHSTARNIFLRAMRKIASEVASDYNDCDSDAIAEDPRFQAAIQELASEIL